MFSWITSNKSLPTGTKESYFNVNPLSANPIKCSNKLKQFVSSLQVCLTIWCSWRLKSYSINEKCHDNIEIRYVQDNLPHWFLYARSTVKDPKTSVCNYDRMQKKKKRVTYTRLCQH